MFCGCCSSALPLWSSVELFSKSSRTVKQHKAFEQVLTSSGSFILQHLTEGEVGSQGCLDVCKHSSLRCANAWSCHVMMLAWRLWGRFQTWSLAGLNVVAQTYVLSSSTLWKLKLMRLTSISGFQLTGIVCSLPVSGIFGWFCCVNTYVWARQIIP